MKNILYITPAFGEMNVVYKHNLLFLEAIHRSCNIFLAASRKKYPIAINYVPVFARELPLYYLNAAVNRLFPNRVFYGSDPFKQPRIPFLKHKCEECIKQGSIDIIHTICRPYFSNRIGYELKMKYGIPWIAQFLDAHLDNPDRFIPKRLQKRDAELEELVAKHADVILHTNKQIASIWRDRYGDLVKDKIFVMPFCYNLEQINKKEEYLYPKNKKDKIEFSYIGISVGNRNLQDMIEAANQLVKDRPYLRGKFQINIIGNFLPVDSNLIDKYQLTDVFVYKGYYRGEKLQEAYRNSDIFIVIDSPMKTNVFFPSKLLDYFYYQKPIIGITSRDGVTADLLIEAGHTVVENGNIEALYNYLTAAIEDYNQILNFNKDFYQTFSPEIVAEKYYNIINAI